MSTIEESISKYNKVLTNALEAMRVVHSKYACKNPDFLRKHYNGIFEIIDKKTIEVKEKKDYINECINKLKISKNLLSETKEVIDEIGITANEGNMGTLHGVCRKLIKQNEIPVGEIEKTVLNFPYDEKSEIEKLKKLKKSIESSGSVGGRKNNTKRQKYIAKNGNNKKTKKRRFN